MGAGLLAGRQPAFVWNSEKQDNYDIYAQLVGEVTPSQLTTNPAFDFNLVWSPDGLRIAFLRETQDGVEVLIIPASGGAERRLHVSKIFAKFGLRQLVRQFCGLAWSPNGKFLAIVDTETPQIPNSIFLLDVETREKRTLGAIAIRHLRSRSGCRWRPGDKVLSLRVRPPQGAIAARRGS